MLLLICLFIATLFLAYSNGANDNFKGVATLFGSGTTNYKRAIGWATITTLAGSVCSIFLAEALVVSQILLSWVLTLPIAAILGGIIYKLLTQLS